MSYENFCPKRIFRCLCLTHVLNHVISMKNVHTYNDIKKVFTELFGIKGRYNLWHTWLEKIKCNDCLQCPYEYNCNERNEI